MVFTRISPKEHELDVPESKVARKILELRRIKKRGRLRILDCITRNFVIYVTWYCHEKEIE
jgi:hypothetical protein